jgi:hypothetical protein
VENDDGSATITLGQLDQQQERVDRSTSVPIPPALRMTSATDGAANPSARAIIAALSPMPYRRHASASSAVRSRSGLSAQ